MRILTRLHRRKAQMWELIAKDLGGPPWQAVERIYVKIVQERPMLLYDEVQRQKTSTDGGSAQPQKTHTPIALNSVGTPGQFSAPLCGDIWRPEEDDTLMKLTNEGFNWETISDALPERSLGSCRTRYHHLSKKILDDPKAGDIARLYVKYDLSVRSLLQQC